MDTSTPQHRHSYMAEWGADVLDAVQSGQVVHYTVTPLYDGPRVVPVAFRMQASGYDPNGGKDSHFDKLVFNEMYGKTDQQWHNTGQ
ncbi:MULTISPECIES: hypothetical protein [Streptomyces]|uniref:hypothetical protein n=1 Tax=Streptomyces TaxID=1883 RepID=UPI000F55237A|nr:MULTISPECIES: hypothetical protein [Streptomyces]RPK43318.1 hypothetical protein EES37_17275 [Streptomyces sp. ADI91-18]WSR96857.1 hypothetical protein OG224_01520 [Streptomyces goshikiensis]